MSTPFRGLWAMLAAVLVSAAVVSPAAAHTDLVSSDPQDGQTLSSAPDRVTLRFGEDMLAGGAKIVAEDADGAAVDVGPVEVNGPRVSAVWPSAAAAGTYTVAWRAVADDGHPLEGTLRFEITSPSPTAATPDASPVAGASPPADEQQGGQGVNLRLPALFLAALVAVGFFVWRSRGD